MKRMLEGPLPFRKIVDMGLLEYREFACSVATFEWLRSGGMRSVDGVPVRLHVADRSVDGTNVIVQAVPESWEQRSRSYAWQQEQRAA